jgi:hypothetical protein
MSIAPHAGQRTGSFGSSLLGSGFIEAPEAGSVPAKTANASASTGRGRRNRSGSGQMFLW